MAAPISILGFELGTTAGLASSSTVAKPREYVDRVVGTLGTNVVIESAAARTGSFGLRMSPSAATVHVGWTNSGASPVGLLGSAGTLVGSFWFRFPSLPSANFVLFIDIGTAGGSDGILRFIQSSGKLQAELGGNTALGPTISANTWYQVDFRIVLNANPHTFAWAVDGVAQTAPTSLAVASETIFVAGFGIDNANATGTIHIDDAVISVTSGDYPLGGHKVIQLIPDTAGTAVEIGTANATGRMVTNSAIDATFNSADILTATSEVPPLLSAASTGLGQRTLSTTSACGIPMTTYTLAGGETITGVRSVSCMWAANATAAANTLGIRSFNGTTETVLFAAAAYAGTNSTTAPAWMCKMLTVADADTQAELDALVMRIGYSGDVTPLPGIHATYAEVAIKESTSTDANITPSSVAAVAAVPSPTLQTGSVVTATAVVAVAAVPAPAVRLGVAIAPAAIGAVASVPAPTLQAGQTVTASPVAAVAAIPAPTLQAGETITATSVAAVAAIPSPTIQAGGSLVQPTAVAAVASVPAPTLQAGAAVAPTSIVAAAAVPAPTMHAGELVTPASITAVASVPAPAISAGGSASISATAVAAVAGVPSPQLSTGSQVTPTAVAGIAVVPAPTIRAGSGVTPAAVAAVAALPAPTVQAGTKVTATAVAAVAAVPAPTVRLGAVITPAAIAAVAAMPAPILNAFVPAFSIAAVATIPAPTVVTIAAYTPLLDPVTVARRNAASAGARANLTTAAPRPNTAGATP